MMNYCPTAVYSQQDYSKAVLAHKIQKIIGRPSTQAYIKILEKNFLPNCPITKDDILAAEHIFGPDIGSLKGKTVQQKPIPVSTQQSYVPSSILNWYRQVTIAGDIMFVNKLPFLVTISRNIKFSTAELLQNQQHGTILAAIKHVYQLYSKRGFKITTLLMTDCEATLLHCYIRNHAQYCFQ